MKTDGTTMSDGEALPEAPGVAAPSTTAPEQINIRVVDNNSQEVFFKIKNTTKLGKLMDAYAERAGKQKDQVRFLYDGNRVLPDDTPLKLDMEEGDSIDVRIEQIGGC